MLYNKSKKILLSAAIFSSTLIINPAAMSAGYVVGPNECSPTEVVSYMDVRMSAVMIPNNIQSPAEFQAAVNSSKVEKGEEVDDEGCFSGWDGASGLFDNIDLAGLFSSGSFASFDAVKTLTDLLAKYGQALSSSACNMALDMKSDAIDFAVDGTQDYLEDQTGLDLDSIEDIEESAFGIIEDEVGVNPYLLDLGQDSNDNNDAIENATEGQIDIFSNKVDDGLWGK
jgi:hypothetical protein